MNEIVKFTDSVELITLDKEQIAKINERLVEFHRVKAIVGHSTSQSSYSLQTLNMISDSPLSRMKQCISQINKKYQALQEAYFKIENKKLIIQKLSIETDAESKLTVMENESLINTISISMENALREIGMFQNMYDSIRKNNNIPENWSEKDYEEQEIANMIKSSFRIAIQDLTMTGRISKSAVEYWEQLGIHPQMGETLTRKYQVDTQEILNNIGEITIQLMYDFLDEMADRFKDAHKEALKHIGLDELGSEEFMAHGATKPQ